MRHTNLIAIALSIFFVAGCTNPVAGLDKNSKKVEIYFVNSDKSKPVAEVAEFGNISGEELYTAVVNRVIAGPQSQTNKAVIPKSTKLLDLKVEGSTVALNFSDEYNSIVDVDRALANQTLVHTLCQFPEVSKIRVLVNGNDIVGADGKPVGLMGKNEVLVNPSPLAQQSISIKLYFPDKNAENLVAETRTITIADKESIERAIINGIIKGPVSKELVRAVSSDTKLISVEVDDKTCFVNFSSEFISKMPKGTNGETMAIFSIVNTLTERAHINNVQILVAGQKVDALPSGGMSLLESFERDDMLIKK